MSNKKRFRTEPARGIKEGAIGIDKEKNIVRGFAVISEGEAKGHGMLIDATTLQQVVDHGNKAKRGVKCRFGHPNMSSEALGTYLGRAKNFRVDGNTVRADLHIDDTAFESPNGDLGTYILDLAEKDPDAFGASIVFEGDAEYQKDEKGKDITHDENGRPCKPFARVKFLYAVDAVDEPAANEGFFSASVQLSAEVTDRLCRFLSDEDSVENGIAFLRRFCANEGIAPDDIRMKRIAEMFMQLTSVQPKKEEKEICPMNSKPTRRVIRVIRK